MAGAEAARLAECATEMARRFDRGGRLVSFGNGGSSTDAEALAALLSTPGARPRPLPAMALTDDVATLTALANDVGFELVFARPLAAAGRAVRHRGRAVHQRRVGERAARVRPGEGAGHADRRAGRLLRAARWPRRPSRGEIDYLFVMPSASVHRIQEAQTTTYHVLLELTRRALA